MTTQYVSERSARPAQGSPWVALRPGDDVALLSREMSSAHLSFIENTLDSEAPADGLVRSVVLESWMRSRRSGVDPDATTGSLALEGQELEQYRSTHPMAKVLLVVRRLLVEDSADAALLVAISDERGRLLWVEGDSTARDKAVGMGFVEGSDWSEERVGTNAPGTALALDHCVQIFAAEHFSRPVHDWSCSAAPVHDPITGQILGTIDITGGPRVAAPEVLTLIRATVAAAESELRLHLLGGRVPNLGDVTQLNVLGSGRPILRTGGAEITISQRHAEILLLLSEHPQGLTSDQLSVLLDESELAAVTVRAEMSRLRGVFGASGLGSRPYRLLIDLQTDVAKVRTLLEHGDVVSALRLYRSPVLPSSIAPGIDDIRAELRARLQAAVLREADVRALAQWIETVDGREDSVAWRAYLASLDPRSPLHSQVSARVALIDRQLGISSR